jgi:lauroyl/myristoyl acyltransferase
MTAAVNARFAAWIAAAPDQWLCVRRRWPRQRVRIPKGGKVSLT